MKIATIPAFVLASALFIAAPGTTASEIPAKTLFSQAPGPAPLAARTIGGQCAQIIDYILGMSLEELIIRMMCNDPVELSTGNAHAGVLMIPIKQQGILKRVEGQIEAARVEYVTRVEIHIQPGYELVPLPWGASYLGFIFARARNYADTLQALQSAHQRLRFITTQAWNIEMR